LIGVFGRERGISTAPLLAIEVLNTGFRTVIITRGGVIFPNNEQILSTVPASDPSTYPIELLEGQNRHLQIPPQNVAKMLKNDGFSGIVKLRGWCQDALGKVYKSKPLDFEIEQWLKPD
jgi:hypothetical protein